MDTIKAKIDEFEYTEKALGRLKKNKPELFPNFDFTVKDHKENFDCLPTEFAFEGMVFDFDDFIQLVDENL